MLPLLKSKSTNWTYKINPDYYGLLSCLKGQIVSNGTTHFVSVGKKELQTQSFRDAACFLIENSVKPCFKY